MGLRARILLPLLLLCLCGGGYVIYGWVPAYVDAERAREQRLLRGQIEFLHHDVLERLEEGEYEEAQVHLEMMLHLYPDALAVSLYDPGSGFVFTRERNRGGDSRATVETLTVPAEPAPGKPVTTLSWDVGPSLHAGLERMRRLQWTVALMLVCIAVLVYALIDYRVRRPVLRLAAASGSLASGDATLPLPTPGNDEIGLLLRNFAAMRATLQERQQQLQEAHAALEEQVRNRTEELERANSALYGEVQERRAVETDLRNTLTELKLQKFALDQHSIVAITDRRGRIVYANDKFCEISGYERPELLGQDNRIINSGRHPKAFFRRMWEVIGRGEVWHGEICNRNKQGGLYWVDTTIVPFLDDSGKPYQYVAIRTDITSRKAFEQQQETRAQRLRAQQAALLELMNLPELIDGEQQAALSRITEVAAGTLVCARAGVWWFDAERRELRAEDVYQLNTDTHASGDRLEVEAFPRYFTALARERVIAANDARSDPRTAEFAAEYFQAHAVGATLDAPIYWQGACIGVLCLEHIGGARDWHTDEQQFAASLADMAALALHNARRRDAERALRLSETRFKAIAESMSDWIWEVDAGGRYTASSSGVERLLGYRPDEVIGRTPFEFMDAEEAERVRASFAAAVAAGAPLRDLENWNRTRDGRRVCLLTNGIPLTDEHGVLLGYAGVDIDITARKDTERTLARARDTALEALRLKTEFLANISHEVRTPLHGMLGLLGLLRDAELGARERGFVEMACRAGESLLALINNILDFSRLETRGLSLQEVPFMPCEVVDEVLRLHSGSAASKGLDMRSVIADAAGGPRYGDPLRIAQVLGNLVNNAIKFTAAGSVCIHLEALPDGALRFCVEDTGAGIAPDLQTRVFEPFVQGDGSSARLHEGSGLGLAICKQLVERMGGRIGVESQPGQGSRFWFMLPLPVVSGQPAVAMLQ